jgi:hypothetical protein
MREDLADAEFDELCEAEVTLDEGSRHTGRAHVVRLVARRAA